MPEMRKIDVTQIVWLAVAATTIITVGYPLFMLIYYSVMGSEHTFSLAAYRKMVEDPYTLKYTLNTLMLGIGVTALSVAIGVPLAWITMRTDIPCKDLIKVLAVLPFILPPYVEAIAWIQLAAPYTGYINRFLKWLGYPPNTINIYSFWGIMLVMALRFYVYVYMTTSAALEQMDPSLEEAARMSGASMLRVAKDVTIPLVAPSVASGALLAFVATCANFGIPALLGDRARFYVLTTKIYSMIDLGDLDRATAYSIVLLFITATGLLIQRRVFKEKRYTTITGKTVRPSVALLGRKKHPILAAILVFLFFASVTPLVSLVVSAFMKNIACSPLDPSSYTLQNLYDVVFRDEDTRKAIRNSLILAISASTIVTLFGALLAYMIVKTNVSGRSFLDWLSSVPYALPGTVVAIAVIFAFIKTPLYNTLWIILLAYFVRYMSYGVRTTVGSLMQVDVSLEEAARMSGANWFETMRDIVLPLIKPGLIASWILVFMPTLTELTVSILLYPPGQPTIGVETFNLMEEGRYEWAYAMSAIVVFVVVTCNIILNRITKMLGVRRI